MKTNKFILVPGVYGEYAGIVPSVVFVKKLWYRKLRSGVLNHWRLNYVYKFKEVLVK